MVNASRVLSSPALTVASRAPIVRLHARIWRMLAPSFDQGAALEREHANELLLCCLVLLSDAKLPTSNIKAISCAVVAELLRGDTLTNRVRIIVS